MNKLQDKQRENIVKLLVEGNSLRATARITDVSFNTVSKLLVDLGRACIQFHNDIVVDVNAKRIECDEIWSFVYAKEKNVANSCKTKEEGAGDAWTWVGIDADTKLVISYLVGNRDASSANVFMSDIASRLRNRVQLTTDGYKCYLNAVENAFDNEIDYARLIKIYGIDEENRTEKRYSSTKCIGAEKIIVSGRPNMDKISTSYIERQNLTMRMHMRRFTRLTNGFSKKVENHCYAIALHFVYYNFAKIHKTLRVTPAMEAKLAHKPMSIGDIVKLMDIYDIKKGA